MKKSMFSKKSTTAADVVTPKKQPKKGPVTLDLADMKQVSGGLPRRTWTLDKKE